MVRIGDGSVFEASMECPDKNLDKCAPYGLERLTGIVRRRHTENKILT